jgi:hypothetical protein
MAKKKEIDLRTYLAVISILSFLGIFLNSAFSVPVDKWVDGSIYLLMGVALMLAGGVQLFFWYFKDGLTTEETTKIITVLIGFFSFLSGLSIILEVTNSLVVGMRAIIALLAMIIIGADMYNNVRKR